VTVVCQTVNDELATRSFLMPLHHDPLDDDNLESALDDLLVLLWGAYEFAHRKGQQPHDAPLERRWLYRLGIGNHIVARALTHDFIQYTLRPFSRRVAADTLREDAPVVILTEAGALHAWQAICKRHEGTPAQSQRRREPTASYKPKWDKTRGKLYCGQTVLLSVRRPASFQWLLLDAFQQRHWRQHVENPLVGTRGYRHERLLQTVKDLNRRQKPRRLRFVVEADGQTVSWHWLE
jgi:hypothetical protein